MLEAVRNFLAHFGVPVEQSTPIFTWEEKKRKEILAAYRIYRQRELDASRNPISLVQYTRLQRDVEQPARNTSINFRKKHEPFAEDVRARVQESARQILKQIAGL